MMLLTVLFHNIQFVLFHLLAEVLPVLPFCKFVCTNSSNQISFVRLTLYHFLLLSPLIKIEKVDPVYSVTI